MPRPLCPGQPSDALALGGAGFPAPREAPGNKCPRGSALRAPGSPRPGGDGELDGRSEHLCFCLPCPLVPSNPKMGKLVSKMLSKKHHLKGSLQGERATGTLAFNSLAVAVQSLSHVRLFATPRTAARQASPSITISWSLL